MATSRGNRPWTGASIIRRRCGGRTPNFAPANTSRRPKSSPLSKPPRATATVTRTRPCSSWPSGMGCAPPRPAPALGPGRLQRRRPARAGGQEHGQHPPCAATNSGPCAGSTGERDVAVCLRQRAGIPVHDRWLCPDGRAGEAVAAGLEMKAHPHMLRHACGYALANKGDYLKRRDPATRHTCCPPSNRPRVPCGVAVARGLGMPDGRLPIVRGSGAVPPRSRSRWSSARQSCGAK
jgi:hypothetical protein